jgi:hypothetical protein
MAFLRRSQWLVPACALLGLVGCGNEEQSTNGGGGGGAPFVCDGHAVPSTPTFVDATVGWGLDVVGLTGQVGSQALSAADVNGDGYPDLVIHGAAGRLQVGQEVPHLRVLVNLPRAGGGR